MSLNTLTLLNKEFIPLVMDTYGRMGKPFLNFLKDVAGHTADRASGNVNERPSLGQRQRANASHL
jgi:hypothetical protein